MALGKQPKKKIAPVKEVAAGARRNGKAPKKNPKTNPTGRGKTVGGYSAIKLAARAAQRKVSA